MCFTSVRVTRALIFFAKNLIKIKTIYKFNKQIGFEFRAKKFRYNPISDDDTISEFLTNLSSIMNLYIFINYEELKFVMKLCKYLKKKKRKHNTKIDKCRL